MYTEIVEKSFKAIHKVNKTKEDMEVLFIMGLLLREAGLIKASESRKDIK